MIRVQDKDISADAGQATKDYLDLFMNNPKGRKNKDLQKLDGLSYITICFNGMDGMPLEAVATTNEFVAELVPVAMEKVSILRENMTPIAHSAKVSATYGGRTSKVLGGEDFHTACKNVKNVYIGSNKTFLFVVELNLLHQHGR